MNIRLEIPQDTGNSGKGAKNSLIIAHPRTLQGHDKDTKGFRGLLILTALKIKGILLSLARVYAVAPGTTTETLNTVV